MSSNFSPHLRILVSIVLIAPISSCYSHLPFRLPFNVRQLRCSPQLPLHSPAGIDILPSSRLVPAISSFPIFVHNDVYSFVDSHSVVRCFLTLRFFLAFASSTAFRKRDLDGIHSDEEGSKRRKTGEWALCQYSCLPLSHDSLPSPFRIISHSYMHHITNIYSQILQLRVMALVT